MKDLTDIRNSTAARLTVNMWNLNLFGEAKAPASLIAAVDMHFISEDLEKVVNSPTCVEIDALSKKMEFGINK